jgi:hypothetical protein
MTSPSKRTFDPPEKQRDALQGVPSTAFVCANLTASLNGRLCESERERAAAGWPTRHRPNIGIDWLIAVLSYRLSDAPHIMRAYGRTDLLEAVRWLDAGDIEAAPLKLRALIDVAKSGGTISCFAARRTIAVTGMPTPASIGDFGAVVAVAQLALRHRRREMLADELVSSTSTVHRATILARLVELEAA